MVLFCMQGNLITETHAEQERIITEIESRIRIDTKVIFACTRNTTKQQTKWSIFKSRIFIWMDDMWVFIYENKISGIKSVLQPETLQAI